MWDNSLWYGGVGKAYWVNIGQSVVRDAGPQCGNQIPPRYRLCSKRKTSGSVVRFHQTRSCDVRTFFLQPRPYKQRVPPPQIRGDYDVYPSGDLDIHGVTVHMNMTSSLPYIKPYDEVLEEAFTCTDIHPDFNGTFGIRCDGARRNHL